MDDKYIENDELLEEKFIIDQIHLLLMIERDEWEIDEFQFSREGLVYPFEGEKLAFQRLHFENLY